MKQSLLSHEKANLGQKKSRRTKEELKDKEIEILKLKYDNGLIEIMDFLLDVSEFLKQFE